MNLRSCISLCELRKLAQSKDSETVFRLFALEKCYGWCRNDDEFPNCFFFSRSTYVYCLLTSHVNRIGWKYFTEIHKNCRPPL